MLSIRRLTVLVAATVLASLATPVQALANSSHQPHTVVVRPGGSIQAAIDSVGAGGTVIVKAGTYAQQVIIQEDGLTLRGDGRVILQPAPSQGPCDSPPETIGVCVVPADIDFTTGMYQHRIRNVAVTNLTVTGFEDGVFGFGTKNLRVSRIRGIDNGEYGIVNFDGVGTSITDSRVSGSDVAGIYVGDSPEADATIEGNRVWDNEFGLFLRHDHFVTARDNKAWGNCIGIFLLDDGQPEGSGDSVVKGNTVRRNNRFCPEDPEVGAPAVSGGGIVLFGSQHNVVVGNDVRENNHGGTVVSGGIVLVTSLFSGKGSNDNLVKGNELRRNAPADLVQDPGSVRNRFVRNECRTSIPGGLCHD